MVIGPSDFEASLDFNVIARSACATWQSVLISIDGNGYLSQHYPEYGNKAYELDNGGEIPLDYAYQLDDAPDFERFLFITSDSSFDIRKLIKAVENIKNPMDCKTMDFSEYLPDDVNIKEVLLIKK